MKRLLFLVALSGEMLGATSALAQPLERFVADQSTSKADFDLSTALFEASGSVGRFTSTLELDRNDFTKSKIAVDIDLSSVSVAPEGMAAPISLEPLFAKMPSPVVNFTSTQIRRISPTRYEVSGILRRKQKQWKAQFPVDVLRTSSGTPELRVAVQKVLTEWDSDIPLPVRPGEDEGSLEATLKFRRK